MFAYLSPSRLNCWIKCPRAFAFRYLDGIKTPTTPSLFLGTAVHAGLEVSYRHRQLGVNLEAGDVARRLLESWAGMIDEEGMKFDSPAEEQALQKQAVDLVTAYLAYAPAIRKALGSGSSGGSPAGRSRHRRRPGHAAAWASWTWCSTTRQGR